MSSHICQTRVCSSYFLPGHPPTMAISSVRENIERHICGCGHVRIFVFGRDHVWIKWRHGTPAGADIYTVLRGLAEALFLFQQLVARSLARGREKSCERASVYVCGGARTLAYSWRGGDVVYLGYISRYAPLSCIGTSRVSLTSVETGGEGGQSCGDRLNWKFYSWTLDGSLFLLLRVGSSYLVRGIVMNWQYCYENNSGYVTYKVI